VGALLVHHDDLHTHRLGNHKDVGEDDGGIDEASISIDWLEGKVGGNLGAAAAFEEVVLALLLVVFGQVSSSFDIVSSMYASRYPWVAVYLGASPT
jgi:hypothetical protein